MRVYCAIVDFACVARCVRALYRMVKIGMVYIMRFPWRCAESWQIERSLC